MIEIAKTLPLDDVLTTSHGNAPFFQIDEFYSFGKNQNLVGAL